MPISNTTKIAMGLSLFLFLLSIVASIILYYYKDTMLSIVPTSIPTMTPTITQTLAPTMAPTLSATMAPTMAPTMAQTLAPTAAPTITAATTTAPIITVPTGTSLFTTTSTAVDFNKLNLSCPTGAININSANYQGSGCSPQNNLTNVNTLCGGKPNCLINVLPSSFGGSLLATDPCPGTKKTLNVMWGCSSGTGTATVV